MSNRLSGTINTPHITRIVAITLALAVGVAAWANRNRIAVWLAPSKTATSTRSEAALKADELFWHTFFSGTPQEIASLAVGATEGFSFVLAEVDGSEANMRRLLKLP